MQVCQPLLQFLWLGLFIMGGGRRSQLLGRAVLAFSSCAAGTPHHCSVGLDALDGTPVKVDQQCLWDLGLFQFPGEKQSLGHFDKL